jgi:putative tricarboxylic transport membrane protein
VKRIGTVLLVALTCVPIAAQGILTIVAPASPGGGWDQTARALQHALIASQPGVRVQVDNIPGAAGTIGLARFASAERGNPDALLVTGLVMLGAIVTNRSPVTLGETTPIARLTGEWEVIVVPADSPFTTLGDLVAQFKASPATVAWGGGSAGGTDDLLVRLIAEAAGVPPARANYIAFPGGGPVVAALLGRQVTAGVSGYAEFAGQIESGALRVLAVSAPLRVSHISAPTLREQGIDVELANWRGVVAPPGLTGAERDTLIQKIERVTSSAEWRATLARNGWEDLLLTGPAFRQFLIAEQQRVEAVLLRLQSQSLGQSRGWRVLSPTTLPFAAVLALSGLMLALVVSHRRRIGTAALRRSPAVPRGVMMLLGALTLHAVLFFSVGFVPASIALFVATTRLLGSRRSQRDVVIGVLGSLLLYIVFTAGLGVTLPADPLTRVLRR